MQKNASTVDISDLKKMDTLEPAIDCKYYVPAWTGNKTKFSFEWEMPEDLRRVAVRGAYR